jgi:hypothetical protein
MVTKTAVGHSHGVRFLDPTIRKLTRRGLDLSGSLILAVNRRRGDGRRAPTDLMFRDSSGAPGPALVEPIADWDMVLVPLEIDPDQVKDLARAAGLTALCGARERLLELRRDFPRNLLGIPRAIAGPWRAGRTAGGPTSELPDLRDDPVQQAAWDRFLSAYDAVADLQAAYQVSPNDLTAEELHWAEIELEDAVAIAGELEVHNIRWILS